MRTPTELDMELVRRWVDANTQRPGPAGAFVLPHYVRVWTVNGQFQRDKWDLRGVADFYALPGPKSNRRSACCTRSTRIASTVMFGSAGDPGSYTSRARSAHRHGRYAGSHAG